MEAIFIYRRLAAPVAAVWRALTEMSLNDTGLTTAVTEVLGGQAPTFLTFRLLSGAPVRRNVVSVQLYPVRLDSTEVFVEGAFQASLAGTGGRGRRRVRCVLIELADRLDAAVRTVDHPRSLTGLGVEAAAL
ncbi:hypothetical protein [Nocardioides bizhenqiangii]|uniref:Polyketide cyclase n=1 Tax=Nocardioides bizhenqiangii TaxID=3095076 RepID=A0ABZ0ZV09_9ACTN|nr:MULTISPECIES: hypothetical protein [unclassified Nocardioides]MDZ5623648.1 hypothetical protein [Nocardioides sp. HM23]WQQ27786.1 hypothetical protein SHK19_06015 [Nocardioides sp. HM61]